jgi:uncharacterized cofD-like protein
LSADEGSEKAIMKGLRAYTRWFIPGIGVKRWLLVLLLGVLVLSMSLAIGLIKLISPGALIQIAEIGWLQTTAIALIGVLLILLALARIYYRILAPYRRHQAGRTVDVMVAHSRRQRGLKIVAIGGGTGLPSVLRGLKAYTSNITAVVTVADDGGSSGRLRRDMGVLPPGDLRNNIAALADDENLMTQLFQYRFSGDGDLSGHAFGNLFISALAGVTGSLETALVETERVLNITGRVLPSTMEDVNLAATIALPDTHRTITVVGESKIPEAGGIIEQIHLEPAHVTAYPASVRAILEGDVVIIGPGSLYTSILPNLLVEAIAGALRATDGYKIYICNVATQPGETDGYTVADHVLALEKHIGRGMFQAVLANNVFPPLNDYSKNTRYVQPAAAHHEILQRYDVRYTDLVDVERPWRHDPTKLTQAVMSLYAEERSGTHPTQATFAVT